MNRKHRVRRPVAALALSALLAAGAVILFVRAAYPIRYREQVERVSAENALEPALVLAVIRSESGFRPQAVSPIGARGLMQITEETFEWAKWRMGDETTVYDDLFDPETNIRYGSYILSLLLHEFMSTDTALAAYHAGWGSVKRWLGEDGHSSDGVNLDTIPFRDTARYVPKVRRAEKIYQTLYRLKAA